MVGRVQVVALVAGGWFVQAAHAQQGDVAAVWETVATQSVSGQVDLRWSPDGGLLYSNARRGGAEVEYLTPQPAGGSQLVWSASPVDGDGGASISASAVPRLVASVYAHTSGSTSLRLRITRGYPVQSESFVTLPIQAPATTPGSFGVSVVEDGSRLRVWGYSTSTYQTHVVTLDAQGAVLGSTTVQVGGAVSGSAASRDGRTLILQGQSCTRVLTLDSSLPVQTLAHPGLVLGRVTTCGDGDLIAWCSTEGRVALSRRASPNSAYSYPTWFDVTPHSFATAIALSADGSTLALGLREWAEQFHVREHVYSVSGTTATLRYSRLRVSTWGADGSVTSADAGLNGTWVAFGTTGSLNDGLPELELLRRTTAGAYEVPAGWHGQLSGSVLSVSQSPHGGKLAVLARSTHVSSGPSPARVLLFDLDSDLAAHGLPRAGQSVELRVEAAPGRRVVLYRSNELASPAVQLGAMGSLHLHAPVLHGGTAGGIDGLGRFDVHLWPGVFAPGTTHHFQALRLGPRRLTERIASFTVVP